MKNFLSRILYLFFAIELLVFAFEHQIIELLDPAEELGYFKVIELISENKIENIILYSDDSTAEINLRNDDTRYVTSIPNETVFCEYIQENISVGNDLNITKTKKITGWNIFYFFLGNANLLVFISKGKNKSEKERPNLLSSLDIFDSEADFSERFAKSNIHFCDVAGLKEEKEELIEIVDFLKNPKKYAFFGAEIPKGVLLTGPPGTGKTLLAKALAGESEVSFIALSGSEFDDKYVGVGANRIKKLFKEAKKKAPCIIFIDEIDSVGKKRIDSENRWSIQTINQLLTEMDGFDTESNIIVLGATNQYETLDPALLRPGRFDRNITVNLPDVYDREAILKIHARNKVFMDNVSFKVVANNTAGFSGAELKNLLNEASLIAIRSGQMIISKSNIDEALKKITVGLEKKGRKISERDRILTAYHEAGHAVVSKFKSTQDNVKEVSIIPRGKAGGYTWHETMEDKSYTSKTELKEKLVTLLGGRAAEEIALNDISSGAANDLDVATQIARNMICVYGMNSEIGPISLVNSKNEVIGTETMSLIFELIAKSVKEAEEEAKRILMENRELLEMVFKVLLEKETISGNELNKIYETYQCTHTTNI